MVTEEMVEKAAAAIAKTYALMHDARAPYAKIAAKEAAHAALEAVAPMVRNATLEEAAKVAENLRPVGWDYPARGYEIAAAIRVLATPGDGEG